MLEVQNGLVVAAWLVADLVELLSGPVEVVPIAVPAELVGSGRVGEVAVVRAGLAALEPVSVGHWLVVAFEADAESFGIAVAVVAESE